MEEDALLLQDVVVVGFGCAEKRNLTGAVPPLMLTKR
jgi:hypothetical protein